MSKNLKNENLAHNADNINNADIIVYSSAIKKNNIELLTAKTQNSRIFKADVVSN